MRAAEIDLPESIATAPQLPLWPTGLSEAVETPEGDLIPPDLGKATLERLAACQTLPKRCQVRLDELWGVCGDLARRAVRVERADCLGTAVMDEIETDTRWQTWEVLLGGAIVATLAAGLGYVAGWLR